MVNLSDMKQGSETVIDITKSMLNAIEKLQQENEELIKRVYDLEHLQGSGPFQQLARGWSHYISYSTAKILNYQKVIKVLARFPEGDAVGNFPKFLAMSEYRKPKDIISFAQDQLSTFAQRYLIVGG